ncbi:hypothetical protein CAZ20_34390 [Pseudomonas aeruginosa]|nr:hypothetical protein CAZ20_34390 [Pseudomonas aeruginosa]
MAHNLSGGEGRFTNQVDQLISGFFGSETTLVGAYELSLISDFSKPLFDLLTIIYMLLGGIPFLLVAVGTLVTLKVSTTVILVVGPLFIAFAILPQTRQYFYGWVGVLVGFMLAHVLFSVVAVSLMNFIHAYVRRSVAMFSHLTGSTSI